jgi:hypothetical protein
MKGGFVVMVEVVGPDGQVKTREMLAKTGTFELANVVEDNVRMSVQRLVATLYGLHLEYVEQMPEPDWSDVVE